jgi:hypothetical protein
MNGLHIDITADGAAKIADALMDLAAELTAERHVKPKHEPEVLSRMPPTPNKLRDMFK